jgi:DNA-binding IclR family transcriptional regulator
MRTLPIDRTRAVWREVTRDPQASIRTIAYRTQLDVSSVWRCIQALQRLGYVQHQPDRYAPRRIVVGYSEVR